MAKTTKVCPCGVEFVTSQPAKLYHSKSCQRRAQNGRARKDSLLAQVIAHKGSRACSGCNSIKGKRWPFFWNDYDREANNLAVALLLCARCWRRYSGKKLGQEKQMDSYERLVDLKVTEKELQEDEASNGLVYDWRTNGLSLVHLEDIAEDKSKRKTSPPKPRSGKAMPAVFSLRYLAQLPPSERMAYVEAYPAEIEKLNPRDQDSVSTLLCEAASEELASEAPISALAL
jgi:hypothetical protein